MDELLTIKQAAKVLKTNPNAVYDLIRQKRLKALQLGSWKIRAFTLQQFLVDIEKEQNGGDKA